MAEKPTRRRYGAREQDLLYGEFIVVQHKQNILTGSHCLDTRPLHIDQRRIGRVHLINFAAHVEYQKIRGRVYLTMRRIRSKTWQHQHFLISKYILINKHCPSLNQERRLKSVSGLVVKFVVAIDEPGVRFPPNASAIFFLNFNSNFSFLSFSFALSLSQIQE